MSSLRGVRLKLGRARLQRKLINDQIHATWAGNHRPEAYVNPDGGDQIWYLPGNIPAPPDSLSLLVGECLYNFRSALDHLAWELDSAPGRHTMFPLARCPDDFRIHRLSGMNDLAIAMIADSQPCFGVNDYTNAMLWALETFANIDKHRHLNLMIAAVGDLILWQPSGNPLALWEGPVGRDTVLAVFPSQQMKSEFGVAPSVVFGDGWRVGFRNSVMATLIGIDTVLSYLYQDFQAEFFPGAPQWPLPAD